jgi:hypothetical protein
MENQRGPMQTKLPTAPIGVLVSLDETGDFPALIVTIPADVRDLPKAFVKLCHRIAGEAGASIEFRRAPASS